MRIQYSMKSCTLEGYAYGMVVLDEELVVAVVVVGANDGNWMTSLVEEAEL